MSTSGITPIGEGNRGWRRNSERKPLAGDCLSIDLKAQALDQRFELQIVITQKGR
jgi:hypothetical protein